MSCNRNAAPNCASHNSRTSDRCVVVARLRTRLAFWLPLLVLRLILSWLLGLPLIMLPLMLWILWVLIVWELTLWVPIVWKLTLWVLIAWPLIVVLRPQLGAFLSVEPPRSVVR